MREETELQIAEENIKIKEMESLAKQLDWESKMKNNESLAKQYSSNLEQLHLQKNKFMSELDKVSMDLKSQI